MKQKGNKKTKVIVAFVLLLLVAILSDLTSDSKILDGQIKRGQIGQKKDEIALFVNVENVLEEYPLLLEIEAKFPTKEEADGYLEETVKQIEKDFAKIGEKIPLKKEYLKGKVKADWEFLPFGIIDEEGNIEKKRLSEEETIIQAQVELNCGNYERFYDFSFVLNKPEMSKQESLLQEIESQIAEQTKTEGKDSIQLPAVINGEEVVLSEKREYLTPQILLLEVVTLILIGVGSKKKKKEDRKKRIARMEADYSDVVNQLALLIGVGMTTRQAWNRLGKFYLFKRNRKIIEERSVYEAILRMNGRLAEGESERVVYQKFCEEIPATCYHKLMRILLGNLEKGTKGIRERLEEESRVAFEQSVIVAKKQGEEASTKLLLPLLLMMMIVMGIVMVPALIQFQI